ncbi:MAG: hypothetical protein V1817_04070, partial [Candidatus Micrarchaeota archaeon]
PDKHYEGWYDDDGRRVNPREKLVALFLVRDSLPSKLPFYCTGFNEDIHYRQQGKSFRTPPYLFHSGKRSTHDTDITQSKIFGLYSGDLTQVVPAGKEFVAKVAARSLGSPEAIPLTPKAIPPTSRGGLRAVMAKLRGFFSRRK